MEMLPPPSPSPMRGQTQRPNSAMMIRSPISRTSSRMSMTGKTTGPATGSRSPEDDFRTAVKVAIRVRPPVQPSDPGYDLIPHRFRGSTCEVNSPTNIAIQSAQGKKLFVFDRVFGEETSQEGVWDYLSDSVDSFVQGYNVSILAYGQSGAGKSYTMGTSGADEQNHPGLRGVVPRAATALFEKLSASSGPRSGLRTPQRYSSQGLPTLSSIKQSPDPERDWQLKATYVEIYNEQLRDLLVPDSVPQNERAQVSIREDTKGRILLTGLTQVDVHSVDELLAVLNFGSSIRQTDATAINAKSSRSHAVFSLNLIRPKRAGSSDVSRQEKRNSVSLDAVSGFESSVTTDSKLHFVDLAGSERLKNTGAQGERAKEGISINAGLASLGKVISQLSSRQPGAHVSYRDSRLTRLLQDSLGGNAITYMVACITPAEFHLSETLNTVHYAQRARSIQSRPEIQQSSDDGDKNARIERLQAEVAFLREQVRHDRDQRSVSAHERPDNRRAAEMQNQLLDMQESYHALSQRHTRLIAELGRHPRNDIDSAVETPVLDEALGASAVDRLQRSSSFAEAVEQVVLEYEKTIRTLESSLLNTRSSLSNSESTLMERENRIAYMETLADQLHLRIQKMSEREVNNDAYLRDLETQLEGANSTEESSSTLIHGLRKELGRAKDNQSGSEEYITTLEGRLAEAEQDHAILKRELERLEQVIQRQRSIGRLDNLLSDLDTIRQSESQENNNFAPRLQTNGHGSAPDHDPFDLESNSPPSPLESEARGLGINTQLGEPSSPVSPLFEDDFVEQRPPAHERKAIHAPVLYEDDRTPHSPAQSRFMADKLETLTQELFDLRGEHESNLTDHEQLQHKYTIALQTLARLQDSNNDNGVTSPTSSTPTRSEAFLGSELPSAFSHSSSLELSSLPPCTVSLQRELSHLDTIDTTPPNGASKLEPAHVPLPHDSPTEEAVNHAARTVDFQDLSQKHMQLAKAHSDALLQIERLRLDLQKSRIVPSSPSRKSPLLRRKGSVDAGLTIGNVDRANRSCASLRNIALDHFETNPDVRQNFELQLNTIMTEIHSKSEKVQLSESEITTLRKQIDDKAAIIAGLTRERSSLKVAPNVDFAVVGHMRDQLEGSEQQIQSLHQLHATRESALQSEIEILKDKLYALSDDAMTNGGAERNDSVEVCRMRDELSSWRKKHDLAVESAQVSEAKLRATITDLESSSPSATVGNTHEADQALQAERLKHREIVDSLQHEIDEHRHIGQQHTEKLAQLQTSHAKILQQVEDNDRARELNEQESKMHRDLVANLENQLEAQRSTINLHEKNLETIQNSHAEKLSDLQATSNAAQSQADQRYADLQKQHNQTLEKLESQLKSYRAGMTGLIAAVAVILGHETDASQLPEHIKGLVASNRELEQKQVELTNKHNALKSELNSVSESNNDLQHQIDELQARHSEASKSLEKVTQKEAKSSRLVQELEDQLSSNYDQNADTTRRLSVMQGEKQLQLEEALHAKTELEKEIEDSRLRVTLLESQITELRRRSTASTVGMRDSTSGFLRDSLSPEAAAIALARSGSNASSANAKMSMGTTALPSPPPAIPLPPLPGSNLAGGVSPMILNGHDTRAVSPSPASRPPSAHTHHPSVDSNLVQVVEEQETRIRTVEKHLYAEKQLTATLEEALVDLETAQNRSRSEVDSWRKKAAALQDELIGLRRDKDSGADRASLQAVEEEREMRLRAEQARNVLESRMRELNAGNNKKKKKGALNCF